MGEVNSRLFAGHLTSMSNFLPGLATSSANFANGVTVNGSGARQGLPPGAGAPMNPAMYAALPPVITAQVSCTIFLLGNGVGVQKHFFC